MGERNSISLASICDLGQKLTPHVPLKKHSFFAHNTKITILWLSIFLNFDLQIVIAEIAIDITSFIFFILAWFQNIFKTIKKIKLKWESSNNQSPINLLNPYLRTIPERLSEISLLLFKKYSGNFQCHRNTSLF